MEGIRKASHAGSWYSDSRGTLESELTSYLSPVPVTQPNTRLIIGPHAGFAYSGPTAAWAYKQITPSAFTTVFLLGPSHHTYIEGCFLPCSSQYATPLGNLPVHSEIVEELRNTGKFGVLRKRDEEKEHSLEMHLPFIRKVFENREISIVPIMVGNLNKESTVEYGAILQKFLRNPQILFVISSDFCHWGDNFDYKPYERSKGQIFEFIESLDRTGIEFIQQHDLDGFSGYLESTGNTICGCNPISIAISTILQTGLRFSTRFIRYAQSNQVKNAREFSVSYASSVTYLE